MDNIIVMLDAVYKKRRVYYGDNTFYTCFSRQATDELYQILDQLFSNTLSAVAIHDINYIYNLFEGTFVNYISYENRELSNFILHNAAMLPLPVCCRLLHKAMIAKGHVPTCFIVDLIKSASNCCKNVIPYIIGPLLYTTLFVAQKRPNEWQLRFLREFSHSLFAEDGIHGRLIIKKRGRRITIENTNYLEFLGIKQILIENEATALWVAILCTQRMDIHLPEEIWRLIW